MAITMHLGFGKDLVKEKLTDLKKQMVKPKVRYLDSMKVIMTAINLG